MASLEYLDTLNRLFLIVPEGPEELQDPHAAEEIHKHIEELSAIPASGIIYDLTGQTGYKYRHLVQIFKDYKDNQSPIGIVTDNKYLQAIIQQTHVDHLLTVGDSVDDVAARLIADMPKVEPEEAPEHQYKEEFPVHQYNLLIPSDTNNKNVYVLKTIE